MSFSAISASGGSVPCGYFIPFNSGPFDPWLHCGSSTEPCYACVAPPCQEPKLLGINAAN